MNSQLRESTRRHTGCEGFTIIEVMISILVLTALTLIFVSCVPVARKTAKMNGQYSQAISLCQHKIDQLRAVGYGRLTFAELDDPENIIDSSPTSSPYSFVVVDDVAAYLPNPTATVTIEPVSGRADEMLITARVTWRNAEHEAKTSSASLSAIIANVE